MDRITQSLMLEGASGGHLVQALTPAGPPRAHHIPSAFEDLQEGHDLSGQPPVLCHPNSTDVLPDVQRKPLVFQFVLTALYPSTAHA